ncbi:MAG: hypothetical protein WAN11_01945 [Syntrophobacteraceae bacterium]
MKARLLKTAAKGLILGASIFALATGAQAATYVNLHGATAQYNFWSHYAPTFLSSVMGCTVASTNSFSTADGKSTVTIGTSCTGIPSGDAHNGPNGNTGGAGDEPNAIYFSYSNKASWDGVGAVIGQYSASNNGGAANPCSTNFERQVATCPDDACTGFTTTTAPYICQPIDIGASDVEASAFVQTSTGTLFGPLDPGTTQITRGFTHANALNVSGLPASGHYTSGSYSVKNPETPISYPFSFYVNPGVEAYQCASGIHQGSYCADDRNCGGTAGDFTICTLSTITNLTRLQAVALFSGTIKDWSEFGAAFPAHPVTLCFRHAGSGTSATLDWGVMNGNGWGTHIYGFGENRASTGTPPYIYFNDGTGDLKNCMNWAAGATFSGADGLASGEEGGAVGYMDSDNANASGLYTQVAYNGQFASRVAMHDGIYDDFWTVNRLYVPSGLPQQVVDFYAAMLTALKTPANISDANLGGGRGEFYGTFGELNFPKATSPTYPSAYSASTTPATPN